MLLEHTFGKDCRPHMSGTIGQVPGKLALRTYSVLLHSFQHAAQSSLAVVKLHMGQTDVQGAELGHTRQMLGHLLSAWVDLTLQDDGMTSLWRTYTCQKVL